eukprot:TRINITY_DN930_c0_g1_i1.p1 TRINITY_DN930_c0_g1~~TRINITY_DN930_c0_g1_i1.p1  ORF type:complete len:350 (+),score=81.12 TRINITY_DN930_c0_g1_i1:93-1142(+)
MCIRDRLIAKAIPVLLCQAAVALGDGRLRRPLDKVCLMELCSNRSFSAAPSTQRSGGTDSETLNSFNETSSPSDRSLLTRNDRSSSERDLSLILRREESQILERNRNFLNPIVATWDSNSSRSPNTSGSKDRSFYDDANSSQYFINGCYYPSPVYTQTMYPTAYFQTNQYTQKYKKAVYVNAGGLNQQSKPFVPKREEMQKLDPAAPAFDQKKKGVYGSPTQMKEDKKEVKSKPNRRPLGNTTGNSIPSATTNTAPRFRRQFLNRNKLTFKRKNQTAERDLSDSRMMKSRDNVNNAMDQDDNDTLSDVYASEELVIRKKGKHRKKKTARGVQKTTNNGGKRSEPGSGCM